MLFLIFKTATGMRSERLYWQYILWRQDGYRESARLDKKTRERIFPKELLHIMNQNARPGRHKPCILELGPGPLSDLAWGVETGKLTVIAIDPLADAYRRILVKNRIIYPINPVRGFAERLQFKDGEFDAVYARNSLDHATDLDACIREATRVCKRNGIMYICGTVREGSRVRWEGLHQHDLVPEHGHLVRYGKDGRRTTLTEGLGLRCIMSRITRDASRERFVIVFKKL
jgi:SAM-dependent methyltransferase